mmetsp:Transcript_23475/g.24449  ORF Transcript_23475/g.24449 Transcript_23475/m.24449 type:complete len:295 (+) Transcript_23475:215-1099(+)
MRQISSCDFFYPLIEDPYLQGKIAVANVLSDIYAMGVPHIDNVLMILGVSQMMKENEREVITREMIRGFNDSCTEADTKVTGGQSVMNPWPMIGGTAISTVKEENVIYPYNIKPGDHLILTKPLGTQVVVNTIEWMGKDNDLYKNISGLGISNEEIWSMYSIAVESMARLNKKAAELMVKYKAHGATDITGFGFYGHAKNLVEAQKKNMEFVFHSLPLIRNTEEINNKVFNFGLIEGNSAETSGGLLLAVSPEDSHKFIEEMIANNEDAWIVGSVKESEGKIISFEKEINRIII